MAEHGLYRLNAMRALYLGLCLFLIFLNLLPLNMVPQGWAGPDLMLALSYAWVLRRPDYVPALLVVGVFLLTDFLFHRPPGLWSAAVLIGLTVLRSRAAGLRDLTFAVEWLSVTIVILAIMSGYRIILAILLLEQPALGLSLVQATMTILAYPLVAGISQVLFGVRKPTPGDIGIMGPNT